MGAVKNKSQNKKAKVNLISATIKNITGGLLEYTKEYLPGVTSVLEDSKEIIEDVKKTTANSSGSVLSTFKSISRLISFKNLFDWYTDQGNQFGGDEDSFGDDLNFDIGGDSGDDSSSDELAKDLGTAEINEMKKSSDKVSKTVVETSQKMAELQVTSLAHITNSLEKTNSLITSGFETVNNSIKDLIKIVSENTASLIKIASVGREEENTYYNNQKQFGMADLLRGGGFKAKDYFGYLKNKMSSTVGMAGTIFDMLGTLTSSPEMAMSMLQEQKKEWIGQGFHWIIEKAFPGFSRGLKNLERSVGDWFSSALIDLGKGKNPITGKPLEGWFRSIGEFFGVVGDFRGVGNLQLESFERKKISFDTETKESIVRIIPGYLREISTALGNVDKIYDYNKRSFVSTQDLRQRYQKEIADNYRVSIDTSKMQQYKKDNNGNLVKDENGKLIIEEQDFVKAYDSSPEIQAYANKIISVLMYRAANGSRDDIVDYYKKLNVPKCSLNHSGTSKFSNEVYEILGIPEKEKTFEGKKGIKLNLQLTYALEMIKAVMENPLYDNTRKELLRQANYKTEAHMRINKQYAEDVVTDNSFFGTIGKQSNEELIRNAFTRESFIQNKHHQAKLEELKNLLAIGGKGLQDKFTTNANNAWGNKKKAKDFDEYLANNFGISFNQLDRLTPQQLDEVISGFTDLGYNNQDENITNFKNKLAQRAKDIDEKFNTDNPSHLINSGNISNVLKNSSSAGVGAAASSIRGASTTISSGITQLLSLFSGLSSLSASSPVVPTFSFDTDLTNFGNSYIEPIKDILTNYCTTSNSDLVTKTTEISLILNDIKTISSEIKTVNSDKIIFEDIKKLEEKGISSLESIKTSVQNLESYSKSLTVPSTTSAPAPLLPTGPIEVKIASDSITEMLDSFKAMVAANIPSGTGTTALVPVTSSGGTVTAVPVTSQTLNPWQQLGSMLGFTSAPALPAPGTTVSGTTAATAGVATAGNNIFTVVQSNLAQAGQRIATAVQQGAAKVQAMTMGGEYIENKLDANGNVIGQVKVTVENGGIIGGAKDFLDKMIPSEGVMRDVFNKGKAWLLAPRPSTAKSAKGKEMDKKSEERRANLVTTVLGGLIGGATGSLPGLVIGAMIGASEPISEIGFNFKEIVFGDLFDRQAKNPKMGLLEKGFVEFVLPFKLEVKKTWQHLWFYFKKDLLGPFQDMIAGFKNWAAKRKGKVLKSLLDWWKGTWFGQRIDKITRLVANFATGFGKNAWNLAKGFFINILPGPIRAFSQAAMNITGQVPKILNNAFSKWFGPDFAEGARLNREKRLADLFKSLQKSGNLVGFDKNDKEFNKLSETSKSFRELMGTESFREYYEKHPELHDKNKMQAAILEDQRKWVQTRMQLKSILFGSSYVDSDSNPFSETLAAIQGKDGKGEGNSILGWLKKIAGALSPNGANGGVVIGSEGEAESPVISVSDKYLNLLQMAKEKGDLDEYTMNEASNFFKEKQIADLQKGNLPGTVADNIADALKEGKINEGQARALLNHLNSGLSDAEKDNNTRIVEEGIRLFNSAKNNEQKANGPVENPIVKFFKGIWDFSVGWIKELFRANPLIGSAFAILPGLLLTTNDIANWAHKKFVPTEESENKQRNREGKQGRQIAQTVTMNNIMNKNINKDMQKFISDRLAKGMTPDQIKNDFKNEILDNANFSEAEKTKLNENFNQHINSKESSDIIAIRKKGVTASAKYKAAEMHYNNELNAANKVSDPITRAKEIKRIETKYQPIMEASGNEAKAAAEELFLRVGKNTLLRTNPTSQLEKLISAGKMKGMVSIKGRMAFNIGVSVLRPVIIAIICSGHQSNSPEDVAFRESVEFWVDNISMGAMAINTAAGFAFDIPKILCILPVNYVSIMFDKFIGSIGETLQELNPWNTAKVANTNRTAIATEWKAFISSFKTLASSLKSSIIQLFTKPEEFFSNIIKQTITKIGTYFSKENIKTVIIDLIDHGLCTVWGALDFWAAFGISDETEKLINNKKWDSWLKKIAIQASSFTVKTAALGGNVAGALLLPDPKFIKEKLNSLPKTPAEMFTIMRTMNSICNDLSMHNFFYLAYEIIGDIAIELKYGGKGMKIEGLDIPIMNSRMLILWKLFLHMFGADPSTNEVLAAANKGYKIYNEIQPNIPYHQYTTARGLLPKIIDGIRRRHPMGDVILDRNKATKAKALGNSGSTIINEQTGRKLDLLLSNGETTISNAQLEEDFVNEGYVIDQGSQDTSKGILRSYGHGLPIVFDGGKRKQYSNGIDNNIDESVDTDQAFFKINPFVTGVNVNDKDIKQYRSRYLDIIYYISRYMKKHKQKEFLNLLNAMQDEKKNNMALADEFKPKKKFKSIDDMMNRLEERHNVKNASIIDDYLDIKENLSYDVVDKIQRMLEIFYNDLSYDEKSPHLAIEKFLDYYKLDKNNISINNKPLNDILEYYRTLDFSLYKKKFKERTTEGEKSINWANEHIKEIKQQAKEAREQNKKNTGDSDQESNGVSKEKEAQGTGAIAPVATVPNSNFIYPVENYSKNMLVSDFYNNRGDHIHGGVDIAANAGTGIRAASDGWLVHKGWENPNNHRQGYGYFLVIKDPKSGNKYIYGHMQKFSKEIDQLPLHGQIKKGTYLGEMGSTGHSTGPHLHFEIRKGAPGEGDDYGTEARAVDVSTALATRYDPIKYLEDNGVASAPTDKNNQISEGSIADLSGSEGSSNNLLNELLGFDKIGALINKFLGDLGGSKAINDKGSPYISSDEGFIDTSKYKFNKVKGEKISISKEKQAIATKVYNVLRAKGFSHTSAAAVLGNLWQESNLRPDVVNSIGAAGIAQWLDPERRGVGRRSDLEAFAKKYNNGVWEDPEIQARFLAYELSKGEAYYGNKNYYVGDFNDMDLDKATVMWRRSFERCGEAEANDENRLRYAHYFDKAFAKNSGGESPFEQLNFLRYRNLLNHNKNLRFKSQLSSRLSQFPVELSNLQNISNVSNINNLLPQLAAKETASKKEDSLELKQIAQLLMKVIEAIEAGNMLKSSELKNKITDATQMNNIVRQFENNIKTRTAKFKTTQPFNSPFPTAISSLVLGI